MLNNDVKQVLSLTSSSFIYPSKLLKLQNCVKIKKFT